MEIPYRFDVGDQRVPVVVQPIAVRVERDYAGRRGIVDVVVETQLDRSGVAGEDAEVDTIGRHVRTERMGSALRSDHVRILATLHAGVSMSAGGRRSFLRTWALISWLRYAGIDLRWAPPELA